MKNYKQNRWGDIMNIMLDGDTSSVEGGAFS